jgi:hypothetical protein
VFQCRIRSNPRGLMSVLYFMLPEQLVCFQLAYSPSIPVTRLLILVFRLRLRNPHGIRICESTRTELTVFGASWLRIGMRTASNARSAHGPVRLQPQRRNTHPVSRGLRNPHGIRVCESTRTESTVFGASWLRIGMRTASSARPAHGPVRLQPQRRNTHPCFAARLGSVLPHPEQFYGVTM